MVTYARLEVGCRRAPRFAMKMLLLCTVVFALHPGFAASFSVRVEPESVGVGETATLQLVFTDCGKVAPPQLPVLENCAAQFSGSSQNYSLINGSASTALIHQYVLQPKSAGVVQIPAMEITVNGQKLTSNPVTLRVGKGVDISEIGFVKVVTPKPTVYLGETFPVEVKFYFRQSPQEVAPNPAFKLDGFTINKQGQRQSNQERVGAEVYGVVTWRLSLTPVKTGDLEFGPAEVETIFLVQSANRRRGPFDDPIFERMFGGGGERRRFTFSSETNTLKVLAPPAQGRPPGFSGAVGRYTFEISASPTNVVSGDPITVRLRAQGRGNFDALRLPEFPTGNGFQAYPGTNSFEPSDELGLEGVKNFEVVLVPDNAGVKELRWPAFSFWNPDTKRYDTVEPRVIPLNVRPGLTAQASPSASVPQSSATPARPPANDFRPPATRLGPLMSFTRPWVTQSWFLGLVALPPVAYLALVLVLRIQARPRDRSRSLRQQREAAIAVALRSLADSAPKADAVNFFQALNPALQERLALTLGGTVGSFTVEIVEARLLAMGLSPTDAERLHRLFAALDQARYSPVASTAELELLRADAEAADAALRQLEATR